MVKMGDRISNLLPPPPDWSDDKISSNKAKAIEIYNSLKDDSDYLAKRVRQKIDKNPPKFENAEMMSQLFERYIGIDYSGAETPTSSLKGLRIYMADRTSQPIEVQPPPSPRRNSLAALYSKSAGQPSPILAI